MRKDKWDNIIKVSRYLTENPEGSWVRQISRDLGLHPETVRRVLTELSALTENSSLNDNLPIHLATLPTMIKLKPGITLDGILRFLKVKERLSRRV